MELTERIALPQPTYKVGRLLLHQASVESPIRFDLICRFAVPSISEGGHMVSESRLALETADSQSTMLLLHYCADVVLSTGLKPVSYSLEGNYPVR